MFQDMPTKVILQNWTADIKKDIREVFHKELIKQRLDSLVKQVTSLQLSSDQYAKTLPNLEPLKTKFEPQLIAIF